MVFDSTEDFLEFSIERTCRSKVGHLTRKAAKAAVRAQRGAKLHIYRCPHCDKFHLTSQRNYSRR